MRIALLGTGIMGASIARSLVGRGHQVSVWNRTRSKAEKLAAAGVDVAVSATPSHAATGAEVLVTMLREGGATESVLTGPHGAFAADHGPDLWIQSATVGEEVDTLVSLAEAAGVTMLDAPVVGTADSAQGELTTLLAGPVEARERAEQVIAAWSSRVLTLADEPGVASRVRSALERVRGDDGFPDLRAFVADEDAARAAGLDDADIAAVARALQGR